MNQKKEIFLDIIEILKKKGKKYKKRVGFWHCFNFNGGFTLVYDSFLHYMSMESGHIKFIEEKYFGPNVKMELFIGEPDEIAVRLEYLEKIRIKLKE